MIVGRFAPSPTGALHRGSLIAALASYCDAKNRNGQWWLRIDNIDPPREDPTATQRIRAALTRFGFVPDKLIYQSDNMASYEHNLAVLNQSNLLYPCVCTRKSSQGKAGCHGSCATDHHGALDLSQGYKRFLNNAALRCRIRTLPNWTDAIQDADIEELQDPVVWRKDGLVSYALACAVDDSESITHVVRGSDLMQSTSVQLALMQALNRTAPSYAHVPVAVNAQQQKLSKQTQAEPIDDAPVLPLLHTAWQFLGQSTFNANSVEHFWSEAIATWTLNSVPKVDSQPDPVSLSLDQN